MEMTNKGKGKGKEVTRKGYAGKHKVVFDGDKTGNGHKRNNPGVLQFFDDDSDVEESNFSDFSDDDSDFARESPHSITNTNKKIHTVQQLNHFASHACLAFSAFCVYLFQTK